MPLINTSVPNLIQGVSQQSDAIRYAGQCEEQENALSSVSDGLTKRAGANHVAEIVQDKIKQDSFVHFIDRSSTERYVVVHTGSYLYIYNLFTGRPASIWYETVEYTNGWYIPEDHYLRTEGSPLKDLKGISIGDSSFITNRNVTVEESSVSNSNFVEEAIVVVNQGDYEKNYTVEFGAEGTGGGTSFSFLVQAETAKAPPSEPVSVSSGGQFYNLEGDVITVLSTVVINSIGQLFDPNLTDNTDILSLRVTDESNRVWDIPMAITTNDDGVLTSVSVRSSASDDSLDGYTFPASADQFFTFDIRGLSQRASLGQITVTTGAADATEGGKNADTSLIAAQLAGATNVGTNNVIGGSIPTGFTAQAFGSVVLYKRTDGEPFSIGTSDGLADDGLSLAYKSVESITDLPIANFNNFKIKILGDPDVEQDDYYLKFETDDGSYFGEGEYVEIAEEGLSVGVDSSTFPHRLVNDAPDSFIIQSTPLVDRIAGNTNSNPAPNFVGNTISNLIIHRNRLGVISADKLSFSEADQFFNFFRTTVSNFLDSAPININIATKNVIRIIDALGFQDSLILFTRRGQYAVKGDPTFTAKTVSISPLTSYETSERVSPIALGSYIYFGFDRKQKSGIREYTVNSNTNTFDASDITEAVPNYIEKNIKSITGSSTEQMIAVVTEDALDTLGIYSYFWSNNSKVLSAWSKFKIKGDIVSASFVDSSLYIVTTTLGSTNILEIDLEKQPNTEEEPEILMDYRVPVTIQAGQTHVDLPYSLPSNIKCEVYTKKGSLLTSTSSTRHVTLLNAPEEDTEVYIGIPFNMKYVFSKQLLKAASDRSKTVTNSTSSRLKSGSVFFNDTRSFKVTVAIKLRDSRVDVFDANTVGESIIDKTTPTEGVFRFFILAPEEDTTITLENNTVFTSSFLAAEFERFVHRKSTRYA